MRLEGDPPAGDAAVASPL
eukprot:ctg_4163.g513